MTMELRQELIDTAQAMNASGINSGMSGNLSVRSGWGMLITPSGVAYENMKPDDIVLVDEHGTAEGKRSPSSEWRFHHDIYRQRKDARAVLHAHPVHSTALACLGQPIPAFHYMVAVAGGADIRLARYATFGSQALSDHILEALDERKACLVANHGMVCLERNLPKALALAIEVEQLAHMYQLALTIGAPVLLDDEEMARVVEKFRDYGPAREV